MLELDINNGPKGTELVNLGQKDTFWREHMREREINYYIVTDEVRSGHRRVFNLTRGILVDLEPETLVYPIDLKIVNK